MKDVTIYSTPTCHFCSMAKGFFKERGIKYTEHDVLSDVAKRQEMVDKSGQMGVPVIIIDGQVTVGFDHARIEALLGLSGAEERSKAAA